MEKVLSHIDASFDGYVEELKEFCRFESVAADPAFAPRVRACAEWLAGNLKQIGFENIEILPTKGHPVVTGILPGPANAPAVLVYGHYDVQPADPLDLWETPPFEPTVRDGNIYCRGAHDDKGQVMAQLKAIDAWRKTRGALPVTVKVLIEGEEEIGSPNLPAFLLENRKRFAADAVLVSDTSMWAKGIPSITYALRGLVYFQIDVETANTDMHSGHYGGTIANPAQVVADILASMKDPKTGRILIEGVYEDVDEITPDEKKNMASLNFNESEFLNSVNAVRPFGEEGFTTLERQWCRPTVEVNGVWGGYQGDGAKTVLPRKAGAKFSMRLVPKQDVRKIVGLVETHVRKVCPPTVRLKFTVINAGKPFITPLDNPYLKKASSALKKTYGRDVVYLRGGGSIPIVAEFSEILKAPILLVGFALPDELAHAPNEHFLLDNYRLGIKTIAHFYEEMARD